MVIKRRCCRQLLPGILPDFLMIYTDFVGAPQSSSLHFCHVGLRASAACPGPAVLVGVNIVLLSKPEPANGLLPPPNGLLLCGSKLGARCACDSEPKTVSNHRFSCSAQTASAVPDGVKGG